MYQFTELFKDVQASEQRRTFRWRGLAFGLVTGWIPAWAALHFTGLGKWFFPLIWIVAILLGYGIGAAVKK